MQQPPTAHCTHSGSRGNTVKSKECSAEPVDCPTADTHTGSRHPAVYCFWPSCQMFVSPDNLNIYFYICLRTWPHINRVLVPSLQLINVNKLCLCSLLVSIPRDPAWLGLCSLQTKAVGEKVHPCQGKCFSLAFVEMVMLKNLFRFILKLSMCISKKQAEKLLRDTPVPFNHTLLLI